MSGTPLTLQGYAQRGPAGPLPAAGAVAGAGHVTRGHCAPKGPSTAWAWDTRPLPAARQGSTLPGASPSARWLGEAGGVSGERTPTPAGAEGGFRRARYGGEMARWPPPGV